MGMTSKERRDGVCKEATRVILDHISERGDGDSRTRELIISISSNLKRDFSSTKACEEQKFTTEYSVLSN
ncbi:hypothetical protein TNCV_236611 [Trichonephila clavipes]|nr:hypothetical protein TNCV_236611 [Trichonephila clavipes]